MTHELVNTDQAPAPIGPYSQGVKAGGFVFLSGQVHLDPATGQMVEGDIASQTERVMMNLRAVLKAAGIGPAEVVRSTIYLADMADFQAVNEVYARFLDGHKPSRTTVQVAGLPKGARVEIDMIALAKG